MLPFALSAQQDATELSSLSESRTISWLTSDRDRDDIIRGILGVSLRETRICHRCNTRMGPGAVQDGDLLTIYFPGTLNAPGPPLRLDDLIRREMMEMDAALICMNCTDAQAQNGHTERTFKALPDVLCIKLHRQFMDNQWNTFKDYREVVISERIELHQYF